MSDSLFFETTEQCNTAQLSFRLRNAAELAQVARRRKVLVLGKPESLGVKGDAVFQVLERSAGTVIQTRVSCTDSTLPKLAKILTAQDLTGKHGNPGLIFLAEPDYGPAFERLCGILDFGVPVLFPSGYLLPGFKGACVDYSLPECAAIKDLRASLAALAGKKVMIWNCGVFFRDLLLPVLKAYGPQIEICGLTDLDKNTWGGELAGYPVYQPADLARLDYDLLVFSTEMPTAFYPAMHFYAKDFTPLLAMHPYCGAGGRVSSAGLAHSLLAARSGRDFERKTTGMALTKDIYDILYTQHPNYSDWHYSELVRTSMPPVLRNLAYQAVDLESEFVNVRHGLRLTPGAPAAVSRLAHVFGPCFAYGSFCNDAETIPAHLQQLCNADAALPSGVAVINHGTNAVGFMDNTLRRMWATAFKPGDAVLLLAMYNQIDEAAVLAARQLCRAKGVEFALFVMPALTLAEPASNFEVDLLNRYRCRAGFISDTALRNHANALSAAMLESLRGKGVPVFDLQAELPALRAEGEFFYDALHVCYKSYPKLASRVYELFLGAALRRQTEGVAAGSETADLAIDGLTAALPDNTLQVADSQDAAVITAYQHKIVRNLLDEVQGLSLISASLGEWLRQVPRFEIKGITGAIVMNCNPFTHGHRHIISSALERVDNLYVFAVEEDRSFFSFADRLAMLRFGVSEFGRRVLVVPSDRHIISFASFPEYFSKDKVNYEPDATGEILMFGTTIAPTLGITVRFFGEEPYCAVTRAHHRQLARLLPLCGLQCVEVLRLANTLTSNSSHAPVSVAISASKVRKLLTAGSWHELTDYLPESTLGYLQNGGWARAMARNSLL